MKKLFLTIIGAFFLSISVSTKELIPLTIWIEENDQPGTSGYPKSPMQAPSVYIEDHMLSFETNHADYVLNIKDENGNVVYFTVVFSTQTQVVLPFTLSGNYEIELIMGYWLFKGCITL
ncbi:MAG: hypothetical protein J6T44_00845 [Prevotella sp.]|nr:hypothetical protein [Prevotella sp.]